MKIVFSFTLLLLFGYAGVFPSNIAPTLKENRFMGIKLLDQKEIAYAYIDDIKFSEISDLAYDVQKEKLFMVSDEGKLFTFNARFSDKIDLLEPAGAVKLRKKNGKKFKKWRRDSEGMTLDGQGRLMISFEEQAKVAWFHKNSDKQGRLIKKYRLPHSLRSVKNFRSKNKSLESLAWHAKYGLITAAEWPLKKDKKKSQTIYALSGKEWHFKAEPEPKSAISAMEVMDDGNVMVLERSFTGYMNPFVVTLKKVYLNRCTQGICQTKVLAKMDSHKGWSVDNFEGLVKIQKNRYLMISDDNDNFFQKTLLIYFEVTDD